MCRRAVKSVGLFQSDRQIVLAYKVGRKEGRVIGFAGGVCISKSMASIGKDIFCLDILQRIIFDVSVVFLWKMIR